MKEILMVLAASLVLSACSNQNVPASKVPSVVLNAVKNQHPEAKEIEWKKKRNLYSAEIDLNDSTDLEMQVSEAGQLIMKKRDVGVAELPADVAAKIGSAYPGYRLDDVERIEKDGAIFYQFELDAKGKRDIKLVLSANGMVAPDMSYWE